MTTRTSTGHRLIILLFLLAVFFLALTKIEDTDTWTHLSFGKWIWEHRALPVEDPFITTGKPFPYNNWFFAVTYYLSYLAMGIDGVILLKALVAVVIFFLLFRDSLRPHENYTLCLLVITVMVLMVRHRFVERPDTFMMVFLSFSIFSLNAYLYDSRKFLYALPMTHLLWANSHTSIALMVVPFLAFIGGGALQLLAAKKTGSPGRSPIISLSEGPSLSQIKVVAIVFLASLAASLISPYFTDQYTHSVQALASDWWKQEILELKPPTWQNEKPLFIVTCLVILSFALNRKRLSLIDCFMVIPLLALTFTAQRFIWFVAIAGPVMARNLSAACAARHACANLLARRPIIITSVLITLVSSALYVMHVKPFDVHKEKDFGLGINDGFVPEGALKYMDSRGITGRVFNLFQLGGYITWRDFPKRTAFIDGRGFLSSTLLEKAGLAFTQPPILDELERTYGFDAVLAMYPLIKEESLHEVVQTDHALTHSGWALVYWDDFCLLYVKKGGKYESVIARDAYRFVKPANRIERSRLTDADYRLGLVRELERARDETGSARAYALLGFVLNELGLHQQAVDALSKVRETPFHNFLPDAYAGSAYALSQLGNPDMAITYYKKALSEKKDATLLRNLGDLSARRGDRDAAVAYYREALNLNGNLISVYPQLISLYRQLGKNDEAEKAARQYESASVSRQGEEHFKNGTKAYLEGRFSQAIEEFKKSVAVNPSNPAPYSNMGYVYLDSGDLERAFEYHKRAIDIDSNWAASHYGLALIYKARGDRARAIKHWEDYLRIEPTGYYSRQAKEEIEALRK